MKVYNVGLNLRSREDFPEMMNSNEPSKMAKYVREGYYLTKTSMSTYSTLELKEALVCYHTGESVLNSGT